ncbi:MAG: ester cyclase [Candidatus Nealsonbacteria bacterium]|nr:MAG: ester cyclase [Candidatus Nealsonbacteria bacterium]
MAEGESSAAGDPDANKAIVGRLGELWNTGNLVIADEIFGADFVNHDPNDPNIINLEGYKGFVAATRTSFPDFHVTNEDLVAESDKVAKRYTVTGTHRGEFIGIPPTENHITITGINFYRIASGKIVETWWSSDALGMLQQLGVIPPPG